MTASLHAAGLDLGTAAAVALSYRLVSYWLPLSLTIPAPWTNSPPRPGASPGAPRAETTLARWLPPARAPHP